MVQPDLRKHAGIQDLVERKVDVIVVTTSFGAQAAKRTTSTIPIVITSSADPVGAGLVANLPHPGANVTGFTLMETHLHAKRLELLNGDVTIVQPRSGSLESDHAEWEVRMPGNRTLAPHWIILLDLRETLNK